MKKNTTDLFATTVSFIAILVLAVWWTYLMVGEVIDSAQVSMRMAIELGVFTVIGVTLTYGSLIYFLTRYGRLKRERTTVHPTTTELDRYYYETNTDNAPSLTVLIPSYKEELRIVEMTLLSAALQEYVHKNVVLLVDDPVAYTDPADQRLLEQTCALPKKIEAELQVTHAHIQQAWESFVSRRSRNDWKAVPELDELIALFGYQQAWFEKRLASFAPTNHMESFFVEYKLKSGSERMQAVITELSDLKKNSPQVTAVTLERYYRKALATFNVSLSVFQRKRYVNISHEPNKAMNLNSYIRLIGKEWKETIKDTKIFLEEVAGGGDMVVPAADYLITLDADSILSLSYARRLVYLMEQPASKKIAVAQTPYNTFRSPKIDLERIAGATTDIQHNVHQGFEYFHASFWVGANALLRFEALQDIKEEDVERGYTIERYVQDRTVIEDTESSIDLVARGWEIFNYHEQLAYSATPPDFGSFIIQRRRWANGGLIIFPKLVSYMLTGPRSFWHRMLECFVRGHYLISIAFVSFGVLLMMLYPFQGEMHISFLVGIAFLYFFFYARDLIQLGYSFFDFFRVYALNLLLIPVNVAGTFKSIQQLITRSKIPFGRTPKVDGRTAASTGFIVAEFGLLFYMVIIFVFDMITGRYEHAAFVIINAFFFAYACTRFIGWKNALSDLSADLKSSK